MKHFDVQGIALGVPRREAFSYIADPANLPRWTSAFASAGTNRAVMRGPEGAVEIGLEVRASREHGTVDWRMTFPDGSVGTAYSRVIEIDAEHCAYCFVLVPPPVPLEQLEGALQAQSRTLAAELIKLKSLLESTR
jgi:hypothetical protein